MIRIGVIGHRNIKKEQLVSQSVKAAISEIIQLNEGDSVSQGIIAISPFAEGADRIVADEIMTLASAEIEIVLPLDPAEYQKDFKTESSKHKFEQILKKASKIHKINRQENRNDAYKYAGRFVVDNCDILIAVWDGKESRGVGGTAEIVNYARSKGKPLIWIDAENPAIIKKERLHG